MKKINSQFFAGKAAMTAQQICEIEKTVGYRFANHGLLIQAFTRASYRNEHPDCPDNEVLELIGDSVLSLTVLTYFKQLYTTTEERGLLTVWNEGKLSALKNSLVSKKPLAERMRRLGLQKHLLVSRGDLETGIPAEDSVLEDLFESIIGAIYIDSGEDFSVTSSVVRSMLDISLMVKQNQQKVHLSYRNDLQEWCQDKRRALALPIYREQLLTDGSYSVEASIPQTKLCAVGHGRNIKQATEDAARALLTHLEQFPDKSFFRAEVPKKNYVGLLQEHAQKRKQEVPAFSPADEEVLPDKSRSFTVCCHFAGFTTHGSASSKSAAKQNAAEKMLQRLEVL